MNVLAGPGTTALRMARFLDELDRSHAVSLPADIRSSVDYTLRLEKSANDAVNARREREADLARRREETLASDVPVPKGSTVRCEGKVSAGSGYWLRKCMNKATHVRHNGNGGMFLCGSHRRDGSYGWPTY